MGYLAPRTIVQSEDLDNETRTALWNVMVLLQEDLSQRDNRQQSQLLSALWERQFRRPRDENPGGTAIWSLAKKVMLEKPWYEALDLVEAVVKFLDYHPSSYQPRRPTAVAGAFNDRFEHFLVGYRFIGFELTPVDSTAEAEAVTAAISDADRLPGARHHLGRATELLADRQNPDYPNSIKESISAVEAVVKTVTGEGTLGAGLAKLEGAGLNIHPSLKQAWSKMYGWTSNADGIRHAGVEAADADQALAKYTLVTCSAFVSYLIEAGRKTSLL